MPDNYHIITGPKNKTLKGKKENGNPNDIRESSQTKKDVKNKKVSFNEVAMIPRVLSHEELDGELDHTDVKRVLEAMGNSG